MGWYVRTLWRADATLYESFEAAAEKAQAMVDMYSSRKQLRPRQGRIGLHESDGKLFDVIWVEDEEGRVAPF